MEGDYNVLTLAQLSAHFNPLPPHGGRRGRDLHLSRAVVISIHSLRMEGDSRR